MEPRQLFRFLAQQMDFDAEHGLFGDPQVKDLPWLNHKPNSYEEAMENLYERMRALGATLTVEIDPDSAQKEAVVQAEMLRLAIHNA